jgi:hypothetical protein
MEKVKVKVPGDNYGRVYIGMLESSLSSSAKLCYGVMWSFGQESWATVGSIARRMSVSGNTVRSAQKELQEAGWIKLSEDSKGRASKTWEMIPPTLQPLNPNPSTIEGLTLQPLNPNKEVKQEPNQEERLSPIGDYQRFKDYLWEKLKTKGKPVWPAFKWVPGRIQDLLDQVGLETLKAWVDNYIADPWTKSWTFQGFLAAPDKYQRLRTSEFEKPVNAKLEAAQEARRKMIELQEGK